MQFYNLLAITFRLKHVVCVCSLHTFGMALPSLRKHFHCCKLSVTRPFDPKRLMLFLKLSCG